MGTLVTDCKAPSERCVHDSACHGACLAGGPLLMLRRAYMNRPEIPVNFHDCDPQGRVRLNPTGTLTSLEHIKQLGITLEEGLRVIIYSKDIEIEGVVQYSREEGIWVCRILMEDFRVWNGGAWRSALDAVCDMRQHSLVDLLSKYPQHP